jgi:DHA2 family multidrug resistance protein
MPPESSNSVAGLVNFMRNIGSSIGTSMVTTLLARRAQVHQVYLAAHVSVGRPALALAANGLAVRLATAGLQATRATSQAYGRIYQALIGQATTLAYIDTYWVLAVGGAIMFLLSFALKRNEPGEGGSAAVG